MTYVLKQQLIDDPVQRIAGIYSSTMTGIEAAIILLKDSGEYAEYHLIPIEMDKPGKLAHDESTPYPLVTEPNPVLVIQRSFGTLVWDTGKGGHPYTIDELLELVKKHNAVVETHGFIRDVRSVKIKFLKENP